MHSRIMRARHDSGVAYALQQANNVVVDVRVPSFCRLQETRGATGNGSLGLLPGDTLHMLHAASCTDRQR